MRTSSKMGLRIWNVLLDNYDHEQLADNWAKVDAHDHSPGRGVLIPTQGIAPEAITDALIVQHRQLVTNNNKYNTILSVSKAEAEAGVESSATKMAAVTFKTAVTGLEIGGIPVISAAVTYLIPPGQKWKGTTASEVAVLLF